MEFIKDIFFSWPGGLVEGGAFIWIFRALVERWKSKVEAEVRKRVKK